MIFNLFKTSSRARREPGKLYMTEAQKDLGVAAEVVARSGAETVLLIVHFDSTLRRVCAICAAESIELSPPIHSSSELLAAAAAARSGGVKRALLVRSSDARSLSTMSRQSDGSRSFAVIVADMHPLQSREQQVDALADALPGKTRIMRFGSMDDPLVQRFAGEMTLKMLKLLGADDSTVLQDSRVWGAIERAQRQVQRDAKGDRDADSSGQWLERNLPS